MLNTVRLWLPNGHLPIDVFIVLIYNPVPLYNDLSLPVYIRGVEYIIVRAILATLPHETKFGTEVGVLASAQLLVNSFNGPS